MIKKAAATIALATVGAAVAAASFAGVPAQAGPSPLALDKTAHLGHFDVTVSGVRVDRGYSDGFFTGVEAKVCATKLPAGQTTTRVSWDPWKVTTTQGTDGRHGWEGDGPWASQQFPYTKQLHKGQCATGVIPVMITNTGTLATISYRNSYGETATWAPR